MENGIGAVAPCSGFHQAGYGFGGGFYSFNGLMVAAQDLMSKNGARKISILDLDMHWGNGTQDIIDKRALPATCRITANTTEQKRRNGSSAVWPNRSRNSLAIATC